MKILDERAVSGIVASLLLILITIASVSVLAFAIIPFVRNSLNDGTSCFEVIDKIEIINEETCYTLSPETTKIKVKAGNVELEGIYLIIERNGDDIGYDIKPNSSIPDINNNGILKIPTSGGGERTYSFNFKTTRAGVGVIVNEKRCELSDETTLNIC